MYKFYDFKNVNLMDLSVYSNGAIDKSKGYINLKDIKGKWAVFKSTPNDNFVSNILRKEVETMVRPDITSSLFISSSSKIPRDVVRRSYSITRNPDTVGCYTVVPNKIKTKNMSYEIAFFVKDISELYLCNLIKMYDDEKKEFPEPIIQNIKDFLTKEIGKAIPYPDIEFIYAGGCLRNYVSFLFKCEEFKDIVDCTYPARRYVFDSGVVYEPVPEISIDTLDMWKSMPEDMLYKSISSSNWKEYPLTLCCFFRNEKSDLCRCINSSFSYVHNQLDLGTFLSYKGINRWLEERKVAAQDWNMLQRWICHKNNLPETGGFIDYTFRNDWYESEIPYKPFIAKKVAIKPIYIDEDISGKTLISMGFGD